MSYSMHTLPLREDDINKTNIPPVTGPEIIDLEPADSGTDGLLPRNRPDGRLGSRPSGIPVFPDYPGELEHVPVRFVATNTHIYCPVYSEEILKCISSLLHTLITKTESTGFEWYATTVYDHHSFWSCRFKCMNLVICICSFFTWFRCSIFCIP